jgi:hypothetical protein
MRLNLNYIIPVNLNRLQRFVENTHKLSIHVRNKAEVRLYPSSLLLWCKTMYL